MRRMLSLVALSGLLTAVFLIVPAPEAQADHWRKRHHHDHGWHSGHGWKQRHGWHRGHGRHRHSGFGATIVFGTAPRTVYVERPPRVVYVEPQPQVVYVEPARRAAEPSYLEDGRYCREVTKRVTIDGRLENAYGKACYQPDGSWQWVAD